MHTELSVGACLGMDAVSTGHSNKTDRSCLGSSFLEELGSEEPDLKSAEFSIRGMTCAACSGAVQKALESIPGVEQAWHGQEVEVSLLRERADVTFNANVVNPEQLCSEIEDIGFEASLHQVAENDLRASAGPRNRRALFVGVACLGILCRGCMTGQAISEH
eukprot:s301_g21.t1